MPHHAHAYATHTSRAGGHPVANPGRKPHAPAEHNAGDGLSLPHLRDLQPTEVERDEFGTVYHKSSALPSLPGVSRRDKPTPATGGNGAGQTNGTRAKGRQRKGHRRKPEAADPSYDDGSLGDGLFGSEEARAQEEWRENVRLRRMIGDSNFTKDQVGR